MMQQSYVLAAQNNLLKTSADKGQLLQLQTIQNQYPTLQNHHDDIKIYTNLQNTNQSLNQTLQQLIKSIETKLKPQVQSLKKQKAALFKSLSYDETLRLRENFIDFMVIKKQQKNHLLSKLSKLEQRNKYLKENEQNHDNHCLENQTTIYLLLQQRERLQRQLKQLELKQSVKQQQSMKNRISQQVVEINSPLADSVPSSQSNSKTQQSLSISSQTQIIQSFQSISCSHHISDHTPLSISYSLDSSRQSKQIYNSLQSQLKPVKLNEIITYLQQQIDTLRNQQLVQLKQQKQCQLKILKKLKANCCFNNKKFQTMKVNLSEFRKSFLTSKLQ